MERMDFAATAKQQDSDDFARIDREISTCLTYSTGPAGMKECLVNGMNSWDQELNKTYQALQNELANNPPAKAALTKSESEWIKFRDLEFKFIERQYKNAPQETHPGVDILANKLDLVETRTRELQAYREEKIASPGRSTPIDRKVGVCLRERTDEPGQKICIGNGLEDWKTELETQASSLPSRFRPVARPAQVQWMKYRDSENEFIAKRFQGSDTSNQELSAYMYVLRDRAVQLSLRNSIKFK